MIKALIVDDDAACRQYLGTLLGVAAPEVTVIGEATNIADARLKIIADPPDLVMLDVEMPGGSGFDLLAELGAWPFDVIFTTGFQRYAIQAIRFSALDYLLKPVQPDELKAALDRFRSRHPADPVRDDVQKQFLSNITQGDERALKLTLTTGDRSYFVAPTEISHCIAQGNYTDVHVNDGRRFTIARTLKEYDDMLGPLGFFRIHRSTLVNMSAVSHVDDTDVVLLDGTRVETSRRKRHEVLRMLAR